MKILKVIFVLLAIYFIRRFLQMYRVMKAIQKKQATEGRSQEQVRERQRHDSPKVVNADFKVID